jgi:hypothetical protein
VGRTLLYALLAAAAACEAIDPVAAPRLVAVEPGTWRVGEPPVMPLLLRGENLFISTDARLGPRRGVAPQVAFSATLGGLPLEEVRWLDNRSLSAAAPKALAAGRHDLVVVTPDGAEARLRAAVLVLPVDTQPFRGATAGAATLPGDGTDAWVDVAADADRTILFFNFTHNSSEPGTGLVSGHLAPDGRSIHFARNTTLVYQVGTEADEPVSLRWALLPVRGASVQRGEVAMDYSVPFVVNLPVAVDPTRSFVIATHNLDGGHFSANDWMAARLSGAGTAVELGLSQTAEFGLLAWQVIELPDDGGARVESGTAQLFGGVASATAMRAPAPASESLLLFSQQVLVSILDPDAASHLVSGRLVDDDEILFERYLGWTAVDVEVAWQVISSPRLSVLHGVEAFADGETRRVVSLPRAVTPERAAALSSGNMRQGRAAHAADDRVGAGWFTTELSRDGRNLVLERGVGSGAAETCWQVVEIRD